MAKLVSKTYADALFSLSLEKDKVDKLNEEVMVLQSVLKENKELLDVLQHPHIDKNEKLQLVENIFKDRLDSDLMGFLMTIVDKERQAEIFNILDYYISLVKEYKHIGVAYVTTAVELSDARKQEILEKLINTTDYESFEMNYIVDASVIGGCVIKINDRVIDSSISSRLEKLSEELMSAAVQ